MTESLTAHCRKCDYSFPPRYPLDEYRFRGGEHRLKCGSCNQGTQTGFVITVGDELPDGPATLLGKAQFNKHKHQTASRLTTLFTAITDTHPREYTKTAVDEYQSTANDEPLADRCQSTEEYALAVELLELYQAIDGVSTPEECEAVANRLEEVAGHLDEIEKTHETFADLRGEIKASRAELAEQEQTLHEMATEHDQLEQELAEVTTELDREQQALEELQDEATNRGFESITRVLELLYQNEDIRDQKEQLLTQTRRLYKRKRQLEGQIANYENSLWDLDARIKDRQAELDRLNRKINTKKPDLDEALAELKEATTQLDPFGKTDRRQF